MRTGVWIGQDHGRRRVAAIATLAVHVGIALLLLRQIPLPLDSRAEPPSLVLFDVPRPPEPPPLPVPPPPIPPEPVKRENRVLRPIAGGGSPRPAPVVSAERAAPRAVTPERFDSVDRLAPASDIGAELPLRVGAALSDGRTAGIASGQGLGGEGHGTGNGRGDGAGPGDGRLRFALAEWIERPRQSLIDNAFPPMARRGGISGIAVLLCVVPQPGKPESCSIAAERPVGRGFGAAALGLYPQFRIRPVMKGDQVVQAQVLVPVTFKVR
ncbi:energy transducer TonB [Sphingomonas sp.]|uniref:energy transducer TonB n=1 Tax=Sphingomonas sp. TaxID=28214 RepID=UPI0031DCF942